MVIAWMVRMVTDMKIACLECGHFRHLPGRCLSWRAEVTKIAVGRGPVATLTQMIPCCCGSRDFSGPMRVVVGAEAQTVSAPQTVGIGAAVRSNGDPLDIIKVEDAR